MFLVFHENSDTLLKLVVIMGMSAGVECGKEHEFAERDGEEGEAANRCWVGLAREEYRGFFQC